MNKLILFAVLLFCSLTIKAQNEEFQGYMNEAVQAIQNKDYIKAQTFYDAALKATTDDNDKASVYQDKKKVYTLMIEVKQKQVKQLESQQQRLFDRKVEVSRLEAVTRQLNREKDLLNIYNERQTLISDILRIQSIGNDLAYKSFTITNEGNPRVGIALGYYAMLKKEELIEIDPDQSEANRIPVLLNANEAFGNATFASTKKDTIIVKKNERATLFTWSKKYNELLYVKNTRKRNYQNSKHQLWIYEPEIDFPRKIVLFNQVEEEVETVTAIAASPKGGFAVGTKKGDIFLLERYGQISTTPFYGAHQSPITYLAFSETGNLLFSSESGRGPITKVWSINDRRAETLKKEHLPSTKQMIYHQNTQQFITRSADNTIRIWDQYNLNSSPKEIKMPGHYTMALTPSLEPGSYIASDSKGNILNFLLPGGNEKMVVSPFTAGTSFVFHTHLTMDTINREYIAVTSDQKVLFYNENWVENKLRHFSVDHEIFDIHVHPTLPKMLLSLGNGQAQLWDLSFYRPFKIAEMKLKYSDYPVVKARFSPDGKYIALMNEWGQLVVSKEPNALLNEFRKKPPTLTHEEMATYNIIKP